MPSSALRARLAAVLGLAALYPLTDLHAFADSGGSGAGGSTGSGGSFAFDSFCEDAPAATTTGATPDCGDGKETIGQVTTNGCVVDDLVSQEGSYDATTDQCCWKVAVSCALPKDGYSHDCGCYGRPLVVDGAVRTAGSVPRRGWCAEGVRPARVAAELRPALVRFWLDNAEAEHSSVAGFAKFVLDLLAVGAPARLVARAQAAGMEELAHTRACYALASAYAGFALGPRSLVSPPLALAADLVELAVHTAREGCIGETVAAELASAIARSASDPAVREVMAAIAEEEARHAELAWETLAWAMRAGGEPVRQAVADVFAEGFRGAPSSGAPDRRELRAHGVLPDHEQAEVCARAYAEVVAPLAGALVVRQAA